MSLSRKFERRCVPAQIRQKSYVDVRRRNLEFEIGDLVFLNVALMKDVLRFGRNGKLSPRFIGPIKSARSSSRVNAK